MVWERLRIRVVPASAILIEAIEKPYYDATWFVQPA
jgi:hypothetical protein